MARKKSVSGRSRGVTAVNRIMIQTERINKQLRKLEKAGRYGTYKSKELIKFVQQTPQLSIHKAKKSGRHTIRINKSVKMTSQDFMLINKKLKSISGSEAFYVIGIDKIEEKIRKKIKKSLGETLGRRVKKADLEKFYSVLSAKRLAKKNSMLDKVDPSLFMSLTETAIAEKQSKESFIKTLSQYEEINTDTDRKEAEYLYNTYIKPSLM